MPGRLASGLWNFQKIRLQYNYTIVVLFAFCSLIFPSTAHAQLAVAFVSGSGSNGNACASVTTPCRTIGGPNGALSKIGSTGIVHVLPGFYGERIEITNQSVTIIGAKGQATVSEVRVNNGADQVVRLQGLVLSNPTATTPIRFLGSGSLVIDDCSIAHGRGGGVQFASAGAGKLVVRNSSISSPLRRPGDALYVLAWTNSRTIDVLVDNVAIVSPNYGLSISGGLDPSLKVNVTLRNTVIAGARHKAIIASGSTNVFIDGSSLLWNASGGVQATAGLTTVRVRNSTIVGNGGRGLSAGPRAKIISLGGNVVAGNAIDGTFTSTETPK